MWKFISDQLLVQILILLNFILIQTSDIQYDRNYLIYDMTALNCVCTLQVVFVLQLSLVVLLTNILFIHIQEKIL